jgi:hypothetical protein
MPLNVLKYEVHNVLRIADVQFNLEGHHLFLVGGANEAGKSSALRALVMALCGKRDCDYPDVALKAGERSGSVIVNLGGDYEGHPLDLTVELTFKRARGGAIAESLVVKDVAGNEQKEPRALLRRLFEMRAFDPLSFLKLDKKAQRDTLLQVAGVRVEEMDREYATTYAERRDVNRDLDRSKKALEAMPDHGSEVPDAPVDVEALLQQREAQQKAIQDKRLHETRREAALNDVGRAKLAVQELEQRLAAKQHELVSAQMRADALLLDIPAVPTNEEVAALQAAIRSSTETNVLVRVKRERASAAAEVARLQELSDNLSAVLEGIQARKQKAFEEAAWPIPGLSVDESGVLCDGLPLEQAAKSKRLRLAVKIAMALNPHLRLLVCEDGSDLDLDTLRELDVILRDGGYQAVVELVTRTEADENLCAVILDGGVVKGSKPKPKKVVNLVQTYIPGTEPIELVKETVNVT